MKPIKHLLLLVLISGCAATVHYDYETSTNFTQYKTYAYFNDIKTNLNPFDYKRLTNAIDQELTGLGITKSNTPDFYIDIQTQTIQNQPNSTIGVGIGGTGRNVGGGISVGVPVQSKLTTTQISIEFVNDAKGGLFWQAISQITMHQNAKPKKREEKFNALAQKVFKNYPPKQ